MVVGMAGYDMSKDDLLARLRRIEGQVRGIARMVEGDQYCIDVLTQVSAATKGLQQVALGLFDDHLPLRRRCRRRRRHRRRPQVDRSDRRRRAAAQELRRRP